MKDVDEVMRQKQSDFARLREEVDALRIAIPLIDEDEDLQSGHEQDGRRRHFRRQSVGGIPRVVRERYTAYFIGNRNGGNQLRRVARWGDGLREGYGG